MNEFYSATGFPGYAANGDSASARAELLSIQNGFDKLPAMAGMGLRVIRVNAGGTALESVTLTTAKILASDGSVTPIANLPMGGYKLTGLAAGTTSGDSVRYEQAGTVAMVETHAATSKTTPVDADELPVADSAASFGLKKLTWANLKTTLGSTFAALAGSASQAFSASTLTVATDAIVPSLNGGQLAGFRNRIINGAMVISQANGTTAVTPTTADSYPIDRWKASLSQSSKLTFQQVADAPIGFSSSTKITVNAQYSPIATDYFQYAQAIEGYNITDLKFGTASPSTISISLWIKGSVAGTYSISVMNGAFNRSYIGTITVTSSWAKQTVVLTGDTTGTWATDSTAGIWLFLCLGSGANYSSTAGSWQAGTLDHTSGSVTFVNQVNGSTLNITGVQLEVGSVATPFEQRPYGTELALCQRYYFNFNTVGQSVASGFARTTADVDSSGVQHPVQMRVAPTLVSTSVALNVYYKTFNAAGTSVIMLDSSTRTSSLRVSSVAGSPLTAGEGVRINIISTLLEFTSEL